MRCRDVVELMTEYLEGALSPEDRARFEEHIVGCDGCTAYLEEMRTTIRLTGKVADDLAITPELEASLVDAFRDWRRSIQP